MDLCVREADYIHIWFLDRTCASPPITYRTPVRDLDAIGGAAPEKKEGHWADEAFVRRI